MKADELEMVERSIREAEQALRLIDELGVFRFNGLTETEWREILAMRLAERGE